MTCRIRIAALSLGVLCVLAAPSLSFAAPPIAMLWSIPDHSTKTGDPYSYATTWEIQNPSCYAGHQFTLTQKPAGMTVNSSGVISWNPATPAGYYTITVRLTGYSDCIGIGNSVQNRTYTLNVC